MCSSSFSSSFPCFFAESNPIFCFLISLILAKHYIIIPTNLFFHWTNLSKTNCLSSLFLLEPHLLTFLSSLFYLFCSIFFLNQNSGTKVNLLKIIHIFYHRYVQEGGNHTWALLDPPVNAINLAIEYLKKKKLHPPSYLSPPAPSSSPASFLICKNI